MWAQLGCRKRACCAIRRLVWRSILKQTRLSDSPQTQRYAWGPAHPTLGETQRYLTSLRGRKKIYGSVWQLPRKISLSRTAAVFINILIDTWPCALLLSRTTAAYLATFATSAPPPPGETEAATPGEAAHALLQYVEDQVLPSVYALLAIHAHVRGLPRVRIVVWSLRHV